MKIGFFGDSFVAELSNFDSWYNNYDTYIKLLKDHYSAEIVNLGVGGSSYWDLIIKQFPKFQNNLPDVCVFCWTDPSRLYDPEVRSLNAYNTTKHSIKDLHLYKLKNPQKWSAAEKYFKYLYDYEKAQLEMISAFTYFDHEVLRPLQDKTKIIHLWSFGQAKIWQDEKIYYPKNIDYVYQWKTGTEVRPSLKCFSSIGYDKADDGPAANHLGSIENNYLVYDLIKNAIDTHRNSQCVDYSSILGARWE